LQPVARWRFAAVAAVQTKSTLKLSNPRQQGGNLRLLRRYLCLLCRYHGK
jgi:hypothetical protein